MRKTDSAHHHTRPELDFLPTVNISGTYHTREYREKNCQWLMITTTAFEDAMDEEEIEAGKYQDQWWPIFFRSTFEIVR